MARQSNKLKAKTVEALTRPGRHSDGLGLYLSIDKNGRKRWIFIVILGKKRREMGLGGAAGASAVTLKNARVKADEARKLVAAGVDPIEARARDRQSCREQADVWRGSRRIHRGQSFRVEKRQAPPSVANDASKIRWAAPIAGSRRDQY